MSAAELDTPALDVVVINGVGGLGLAVARRIGAGHRLVLADRSGHSLDHAAEALTAAGHQFVVCPTDVADPAAVSALVEQAATYGPIRTVVHTAGISPTQGESADVLRVNLYGVALVLDAFLSVAQSGTVVICIASQGGYRQAVSAATERLMAVTPTDQLLDIDALDPTNLTPAEAYSVSKRGVHLRVEAASIRYAAKGARAVSVSPGFTVTPQSLHELHGPNGDVIRGMLARANSRVGTPDDIAGAIQYLVSPSASWVNGVDLRVDGGLIANERWRDPAGPGAYFPMREPI